MPSLVDSARNPSWRRARSTLCAVFAACAIGSTPAGAQTGDPIGIILAAGDIAGCFQKKERKYKEVADLIAEERKTAKVPVAVLALGDLAYANRDENDKIIPPKYAECFEDFKTTWGVHTSIMLPVPGNHEYSDDPTKAGVFKTYFNDRLKELGADMDGLFFATRFPPDKPGEKPTSWLIAGLNMDVPTGSAKAQRDWFTKLVGSDTPRCVLVFAHHFFTSSGHHGRKMEGMTEKRMAKFFKVMHAGAATVLVAGHDHNFEQFDRQDPKGNASKTGVRSFVVGTGGAKLYKISDKKTHKLKKAHRRSQAFNDLTRGLLKLVLYADGYTWSFLPVPGEPPPDTPAIDLPVKQEGCNARRAPKP